MQDFNKLSKAIQFAILKHKDQKDSDGRSYFYAHIEQVASLVKRVTEDIDVICAAYLHDTIEDTDTKYDELVDTFGVRIADLVNELTHEGQKDSKGFYFPRLASKDAIIIKFADRLSNLSRMDSWDNDRQEHYLKRSKFWKSE